jgi:phosphoheptose isomerase
MIGRKKDEKLDSAKQYFTQFEEMIHNIFLPHLLKVLHLLEAAYQNGQRIYIMGNGGSAATASHFALDLAKNTIMPDAPRVKAISLTDHVPLITAWSNDTSFSVSGAYNNGVQEPGMSGFSQWLRALFPRQAAGRDSQILSI